LRSVVAGLSVYRVGVPTREPEQLLRKPQSDTTCDGAVIGRCAVARTPDQRHERVLVVRALGEILE
jgi:hypothetical protein